MTGTDQELATFAAAASALNGAHAYPVRTFSSTNGFSAAAARPTGPPAGP